MKTDKQTKISTFFSQPNVIIPIQYISTEQEEIVISKAKHKLIKGCAGARKTDTLIKCAIQEIQTRKYPILFLTMVTSVTDEFRTRLQNHLGVTLRQQGDTKHYSGVINNIDICISTFNSWVHHMLQYHNIPMKDGSDFDKKVSDLLALTNNGDCICVMKTNQKVGLLIIDESQDLSSEQMQIIVNLSKCHKKLNIYCAGDYLQTLYLKMNDIHSMHMFKEAQPTVFNLSLCMRCPKAHVDLNNFLFQDIRMKYSEPNMISNNDNIIDKPVIFCHGTLSNNKGAAHLAIQVTSMIQTLMELDTSVLPSDICIIMCKVNDQLVFEHLLHTLQLMYDEKGYKKAVVLMQTKSNNESMTLDWEEAKGKTALVSIHGDKGKGHKVVFVLGVSELSLPMQIHVNNSTEIIAESLLNVSTTRSTKYLFIGFADIYPSRYLQMKHDKLIDLAYCSWDLEKKEIPEPYNSILKCQNQNRTPFWEGEYLSDKPNKGDKSKLCASRDIAFDFKLTKQLVDYDWKSFCEKENFGNVQNFSSDINKNHYYLIGVMVDLLIQRQTSKSNLFGILTDYKKRCRFSSNTIFISCMKDVSCLSCNLDLDAYFEKERSLFSNDTNDYLKREIESAFNNKSIVVNNEFMSDQFKRDLDLFLSNTDNRNIPSRVIWNVTLLYNLITNKQYKPAINAFMGLITDDITTLHDNIDRFLIMTKDVRNVNKFSMTLSGYLTDDECNLFELKKKHSVSISCHVDVYNEIQKIIYKTKVGIDGDCSIVWLNEIIICALMMIEVGKPIESLCVVNLVQGCLWRWKIPQLFPKIEDVVREKISNKYKWNKSEIDAVLREKVIVSSL